MPKAYLVAHIRVHDREAFEEFRKMSGPAFADHGGRVLVRNPEADHREGNLRGTVIVIEFDDMEAARRFGRVPAGEIEGAVIDQLRAVFRQPEIVVGTWRAARGHDDEIAEGEVRDALLQLDPLWDELFPAEQARLVQLLVERVDVQTDGIEVRLRVDGLASLVREMGGATTDGRKVA